MNLTGVKISRRWSEMNFKKVKGIKFYSPWYPSTKPALHSSGGWSPLVVQNGHISFYKMHIFFYRIFKLIFSTSYYLQLLPCSTVALGMNSCGHTGSTFIWRTFIWMITRPASNLPSTSSFLFPDRFFKLYVCMVKLFVISLHYLSLALTASFPDSLSGLMSGTGSASHPEFLRGQRCFLGDICDVIYAKQKAINHPIF